MPDRSEYELPAHPPRPGPVPDWPLTGGEEADVIAQMRGDAPAHGVHVIPGQVPEGIVPPSTSMTTPRPDAPDDLLDLARQAWAQYAEAAPPGTYTHEGIRRAILAAAIPVIERQVRERVAAEIEAAHGWTSSWDHGLAVRIARGEAP